MTGRWRIVEMSGWDRDAIDLLEPGFIEFTEDGSGQFGIIAVRGWLDCRPAERGGRIGVEFTWEGIDVWGSKSRPALLTWVIGCSAA
jgi:hypothetical protein